jgi:hypothetical protein
MTLYVQVCVVNTHSEAKQLSDRINHELSPVIGQRFTDGMYTVSVKLYVKDMEVVKIAQDLANMY